MKLILVLLIIGIVFFVISKLKFIENKYLKGFFKYVAISIFIASAIEVFVFNFRHFESLFFGKEKELSFTYGEGIKCDDEFCKITDFDKAYVEALNINEPIHNLYLEIDKLDLLVDSEIEIQLTDEGNKEYFIAGVAKYFPLNKRSRYLKIDTSGKSEKLLLKFNKIERIVHDEDHVINEDVREELRVKSIKINVKVPFFISSFRLVILFLLVFTFLFVRNKSIFHEIAFDAKSTKSIVLIIISLIFVFSVFASSHNIYLNTIETPGTSRYQYHHYANSIIHGRLSLDLEVTDELAQLDNPYDSYNRLDKIGARGDKYYWDYAYYKGKYYSYFGVIPCLLLYVPYELITGGILRNFIALSITVTFYSIGVFYLYYQLFKKYFKKTSLPWYLMISMFSIISAGTVFALSASGFYSIPIIFGLALAHLGVGLWLKSTFVDKHKLFYVSLGSLLISLIAGCRPQLLITLFFAIPIFLVDYKKDRLALKKYSFKQYIAFAMPIIIIAIMTMTYNYVRFDSPFNFGASYNLTTNDMRHRGIKLDRTFLGYYEFLLKPTKVKNDFPFLESYRVDTSYKGITISEPMYGGYLFINAVMICSLFPWLFKKCIKDKELNWYLYICLLDILIIVFADTQLAGILPRYMLDFGWLFSLSTTIIMLSLFNKAKGYEEFKSVFLGLMLLSIIMNGLTFFNTMTIFVDNNIFYYDMYYTFMFWL